MSAVKQAAAETIVRYAWSLVVDSDESRVQKGLEYLDKAIALDPEHEYVWYWKGVGLQRQRKWEDALRCFDKSIIVDRDFPESWDQKGLCLQALNKPRDSIAAFHRALLHFVDPDLRSRSYSFEVLNKLFGFAEVAGWRNKEQARRLFEKRRVILTISKLCSSYSRLFHFDKSSTLLQSAEYILADLELPVRQEIEKELADAKLMHETLRSLGTNLEWQLPQGFSGLENPPLHAALTLALACKHEEAFDLFRNNVDSESDVKLQLLFATLLIDSVPYHNREALSRQETTEEKRKLRLEEAERILTRILEKKEFPVGSEDLLVKDATLNNKAVAAIHLANYSQNLDDIVKKHIEALETFRLVSQRSPSLISPRLNSVEVTGILPLIKNLEKKPDFDGSASRHLRFRFFSKGR